MSFRISRSTFLAAAAVAVTGSAASADLFTFTYTDTNGLVASGNLVANDNGNGLTMTCVAGDITITTGPVTGTFNLVPGGGSDGSFAWDNLLYTGPATLDIYGLLFTDGSTEVNIWGNGGPNNYSAWMAPPNWFYQGEQIGTFVISPSVPAPGAAAMLGVGLLASARRRRV